MRKRNFGVYPVTKLLRVSIFLQNRLFPEPGFVYPSETRMSKGKEEARSLDVSHLKRYHWLVFSKAKKGLYCKTCLMFMTRSEIQKKTKKEKSYLLNIPLDKYADLWNYLKRHDAVRNTKQRY